MPPCDSMQLQGEKSHLPFIPFPTSPSLPHPTAAKAQPLSEGKGSRVDLHIWQSSPQL